MMRSVNKSVKRMGKHQSQSYMSLLAGGRAILIHSGKRLPDLLDKLTTGRVAAVKLVACEGAGDAARRFHNPPDCSHAPKGL